MVDRMMRAAKGDITLYNEVESNPALTQEAYTIVGIVSAVSALGGLLVGFLTPDPNGNAMTSALINGVYSGLSVFIGYFIWSYLTYFIGTSVFKGTADQGELQRTIAYAMTPQVLSFIPCVGLLASLWSLYLGVVAVREALDFDTTKALMTAGGAFLVYLVITFAIAAVLGVGAAATGALVGG